MPCESPFLVFEHDENHLIMGNCIQFSQRHAIGGPITAAPCCFPSRRKKDSPLACHLCGHQPHPRREREPCVPRSWLACAPQASQGTDCANHCIDFARPESGPRVSRANLQGAGRYRSKARLAGPPAFGEQQEQQQQQQLPRDQVGAQLELEHNECAASRRRRSFHPSSIILFIYCA